MVIANLPGEVWCLQNLQEMVLSPSTFLKDLVPCEGMRRGTGQGEISAEGSSETWWDLVSQPCLEAVSQCSQNSGQHLVSKEEKGGFLCLLDLDDGNVVLIYSSQVFPNCTQHWFFFFSNFSSLFDPKQLGEGNLVGIIQAPCADISPYDSSYLTVFTFFFFFNWTIFALQYS